MSLKDDLKQILEPSFGKKERMMARETAAMVLLEENEEMRDCLEVLVNMYVANRNGEGEFISCITPLHASEMTKKQRKASKHWAAWDRARRFLGDKVP